MIFILLFLLRVVVSGALTDDDYLTLNQQGRFTTKSGKTVLLQGVNIGGWLIQESWFCPVNGELHKWANLDTIEAMEKRNITVDQVIELYTLYEDNWFTVYDLDYIAGLGINAIRVPFWYRNFMLSPDGKWIDDDFDKNPGFKKLDWVISEAGKRGIYVILDCHGAPGGQSNDHTTGTLNKNELYETPAYTEAFKKMWVSIAERYKDNAAVAFLDLMNEPNDNNGHELPNLSYDMDDPATWNITNSMYDLIYKAIRAVDPKRLMSMEAVWLLERLPNPVEMGWEGVVYQLHLYDELDAVRKYATDLSSYCARWGVGAYNGEFAKMDAIPIFQQLNVSWTTWTYKGTYEYPGDWFMHINHGLSDVNSQADSYDQIRQKWGTVLKTENGWTTQRVGQTIKDLISKGN